jgi:glucose/arabinose dehydrogenase
MWGCATQGEKEVSTTSRFRLFHVLFLAILLTIPAIILAAPTATAAPTTANISFGPAPAPLPPGFTRDSGAAFSTTRGNGWIAQTTTTPKNMSDRTRDRNVVADQRLDQLIHIQRANSGATDPGRWQYALVSGQYRVGVTVGDPSALDSRHRLTVEGALVVSDFVPTTTQRSFTATVTVAVTDGFLTLDAVGGLNTKLQNVTIAPATAPSVSAVSPPNGASGVSVLASVTATLSTTIDDSVDLRAALIITGPGGVAVATTANTDGAGNVITLTPLAPLATSTVYTVSSTGALKAPDGTTFTPFSSAFTTSATGTTPSPAQFTKVVIDPAFSAGTAVTFGPDGNLYAATGAGLIKRYNFNSAGQYLGTSTQITAFNNLRTIIGMVFDPSSTPTNLKLWVTNNVLGISNVPDFTGRVSVLTGPNLTTKRDVIFGLPRACKDHMTNSAAFGPDGWLYFTQGSTSGYGAPDAAWCNRAESPLSAAVLRANVNGDIRFTTAIDVNPTKGYNPTEANAPVQVYASGVRNGYDLVWHSNGQLYVAGNESASGNTPAGPNNLPPALTNLPAYTDYLARVVAGGYYGHPNPSRAEYVLNGGNPTSGVDPFQVTEYPVGIAPDPDWSASRLFDMGLNRSPNGLAEYTANAFNGALRGRLIGVEFSGGDDVYAATLNAAGTVISTVRLIGNLYNPLDVAVDARTGNLAVTEYGNESTASGGQLDLFVVAE